MDNYKDKVQCYINNVTLIDVWKHTEEQLSDPNNSAGILNVLGETGVCITEPFRGRLCVPISLSGFNLIKKKDELF